MVFLNIIQQLIILLFKAVGHVFVIFKGKHPLLPQRVTSQFIYKITVFLKHSNDMDFKEEIWKI